MEKYQETAAPEWLTVLITKALLANFKLYRFSSFKTLHLVIFFAILQLTVSVQYFLFKSIWLHRFSGRQTFYNQWKNLYSLERHTSRKRLLPADCSAVSFLDQIQWNSQLAVGLYLPVRLNSLHWHKLILLHFLIPFFSCPPLFFVLSLSPPFWAIPCVKTYHTMPCTFSGKNKWNSTHHHPKHANSEMLEGLVPNESAAIWR